MIVTRVVLALIGAVFLTGCASSSYYTVKRVDAPGTCMTTMPERDLLVGVALSGGGSRAALFAEAGLEALAGLRTADGVSVINKINHLSSVSGGSLSSTYYVLKKPGRDVPVLNPDGSLSEAYRAFFDQYRTELSQDFETSLIWRQLLSFRWLNSALAARTLAEILESKLYGRARMGDLAAREKAGDTPGLIVNTTLYNNGRRLALTALPSEEFRYDFFSDLERDLKRDGRPMDLSPYIRERWKLLWPMTPIDLHADPCMSLVATAATMSASFAPLIGPTTLRIGDEEAYWHVGDGGLYENSGIESLLLLYLRQVQMKRANGSSSSRSTARSPSRSARTLLRRRSLPFSLLNFDFSRIPSIMEERAITYQALFFRTLQLEGVFPDRQTFTVIGLRHTDAKFAADLSDLPPHARPKFSL